MMESIRQFLTRVGEVAATPGAFAIWFLYFCFWLIFDRSSFDLHALATMSTWAMTLFIQRATHRDTQAIQAKLDELLRATGDAREELTRIDEQQPEEIEKHRSSQLVMNR